MPAYHSTFNDIKSEEICGFSILPFNKKIKSDTTDLIDKNNLKDDIIDEIIDFFRANVLFTNYEIKGNADRLIVYGTLFIHMCLKKIEKSVTKQEGIRILQKIAFDTGFSIPGETDFPLGGMVQYPKDNREKEIVRNYLKQLRETIVNRLINKIYDEKDNRSKWWIFFAKRKFMNKELLR